MKKPLVDITTFNGIQSIFLGKIKDPWGYELAGKFADAFIYSENIRYAKPILAEHARTPNLPHEPSILIELERRENDFFKAIEYSSKDTRELKDEYLAEAFDKFSIWTRNNPSKINKWISLHSENWIRGRRPLQNEGLIFSLLKLKSNLPFLALSKELKQPDVHELCHAFDVVLRTPIYGEMAGEEEHYLNHPLRDIFSLSKMKYEDAPPPEIAISFEETITKLVKNYDLSEEEYAILLHELRGNIWDQKIYKLNPGEIDIEILRGIAAKVKLPPRIKDVGELALASGGILTALGGLVGAEPIAAIVGGSITLLPVLWKGYLPLTANKIRWFRWALKYDIEKQVKNDQSAKE